MKTPKQIKLDILTEKIFNEDQSTIDYVEKYTPELFSIIKQNKLKIDRKLKLNKINENRR